MQRQSAHSRFVIKGQLWFVVALPLLRPDLIHVLYIQGHHNIELDPTQEEHSYKIALATVAIHKIVVNLGLHRVYI